MCVFIISPVPITEPLTSELIDTPVFYNLAPRPIKYRVSVPIPTYNKINGQMYWDTPFFRTEKGTSKKKTVATKMET